MPDELWDHSLPVARRLVLLADALDSAPAHAEQAGRAAGARDSGRIGTINYATMTGHLEGRIRSAADTLRYLARSLDAQEVPPYGGR